jgi:TonB family protein
MRKQLWSIAAVLFIASSNAPARSLQVLHQGMHAAQEERLCDVLANIRAGEGRKVTISGIYVVGPEYQIFYDPKEPTCRADVQPETWVEIGSGVASDELTRLMKLPEGSRASRRAYVTFTGELYGPGAAAGDDLSFSPFLAFANRTRNRRYGHLNGFRTKLVVSAVSGVKSVPKSVAWDQPSGHSTLSTPIVEHAEVPRYPEMAWNVGITGNVILDVTVSGGQVSNAEVKSGDRMLSSEAVRNVKTWRFAPDTNTTFTTTFTYDVEHRLTGTSRAPRIELQLPSAVHIIAASNDW